MRKITLFEHGRLRRWRGREAPPRPTVRETFLEDRLYERLRKLDSHGQRPDEPIFTWFADSAKAEQWVGVIQVPGLQVEILPKMDLPSASEQPGESTVGGVRANLLYMLALAGKIPFRPREVARLTARAAPMSEMLSALFAEKLLRELLRGPRREYRWNEENLRLFKGKMLVKHQTARNSGRRDRFFCRFEEFSVDTLLNRTFKATCRALLDVTRMPTTQDTLRRSLLVLDPVTDHVPTAAELAGVVFDRTNSRFEDLFRFSQLVLEGLAPTAEAGKRRTFSLLFDMNRVFEGFIAAFLRRQVLPNLENCRLLPQGRTDRRHLLRSAKGRGLLLLRPDLLLVHGASRPLVVDTKWKRIERSQGLGGIAASDLYQLHAYTHRYGAMRSVLLFPGLPNVEERVLQILDADGRDTERQVLIGFANVSRNLSLRGQRQQLALELEGLVRRGLNLPTASTAEVSA